MKSTVLLSMLSLAFIQFASKASAETVLGGGTFVTVNPVVMVPQDPYSMAHSTFPDAVESLFIGQGNSTMCVLLRSEGLGMSRNYSYKLQTPKLQLMVLDQAFSVTSLVNRDRTANDRAIYQITCTRGGTPYAVTNAMLIESMGNQVKIDNLIEWQQGHPATLDRIPRASASPQPAPAQSVSADDRAESAGSSISIKPGAAKVAGKIAMMIGRALSNKK